MNHAGGVPENDLNFCNTLYQQGVAKNMLSSIKNLPEDHLLINHAGGVPENKLNFSNTLHH